MYSRNNNYSKSNNIRENYTKFLFERYEPILPSWFGLMECLI